MSKSEKMSKQEMLRLFGETWRKVQTEIWDRHQERLKFIDDIIDRDEYQKRMKESLDTVNKEFEKEKQRYEFVCALMYQSE